MEERVALFLYCHAQPQSWKNLCMFFFFYSLINTFQITEFWFTSHIKRLIIPKIINFLTEIKKKSVGVFFYKKSKENEQLVLGMCCSLNSQSSHAPLGCWKGPEPTSPASPGCFHLQFPGEVSDQLPAHL